MTLCDLGGQDKISNAYLRHLPTSPRRGSRGVFGWRLGGLDLALGGDGGGGFLGKVVMDGVEVEGRVNKEIDERRDRD